MGRQRSGSQNTYHNTAETPDTPEGTPRTLADLVELLRVRPETNDATPDIFSSEFSKGILGRINDTGEY